MATAPRLYEQFDAISFEPGIALMIDLSGVTFLDSSGLAFLIFAHNHLDAQGDEAHLMVLNPTPGIRRLFDITGLNSVLRVEPPAG